MEIVVLVHETPEREPAVRAAELLAATSDKAYGVVEWVSDTDRMFGVCVAHPAAPSR